MATRQYIGARYVPKFDGAWDNTKEYDPLIIVSYQGNSYTSRTFVPANIDITNETYWALTGNYNAQVEAYRQEVQRFIEDQNFVTPEMYGAEGDGINDDSAAFQEAVSSGMPVMANNKYRLSHVEFDVDTYIFGVGTIKLINNIDGSSKYVFYSNTDINVHIEGITFDGNYYGDYVNPWDISQLKSDSECVFVFQYAKNVNLFNITLKNIYIHPAYLSDFLDNRDNAKGLSLAKLIQCENVNIHGLNITNGTGEAIEIDRCTNVNIDSGVFSSNRTSYLSIISCENTIIQNLFVYATKGNSININSSNTKMTNCFLICDAVKTPTTVDVSNEYDNRDYPELLGTTISNVNIVDNTFIDSYVVNASSVVSDSKPDNYNQVDNIYISNNNFILSSNNMFRFTGYRKFGKITLNGNKVYGSMNFTNTHKLIDNLNSVSGSLELINNIIDIKASNVTPTDNNGVILLQNCNIALLLKDNYINFPCVLNMFNASGVSDISKVNLINNTIKSYYFAYILNGDCDIEMYDNNIDCSLATVDGGSKVGCGLFVDSLTPDSIKVCNNKFTGFNLFSSNSSTFNLLEFFKNIMHINTTRANSGIRLLNITATIIRLISNISYTNQQAAVIINSGVTCTIDMYYNIVRGGNYMVNGDGVTFNHAGNIANAWTGTVNVDNAGTLH